MTGQLSVADLLHLMNSERARLERCYRHSAKYLRDSLEWAAQHPDKLPDDLQCALDDAYIQSTAYRTVIDDAEAGEQRW